MVKQVSIFLENRAGRLAEVTSLLAKNKFNIRALSVADTSDFGILRLILNEPDSAVKTLKGAGYTVSTTDVVAVEVLDEPGGLAAILALFDENQINVEYMYAFLGHSSGKAVMIFRFDDNQKVLEKLKGKPVRMVAENELYKL